MSIRDKLKKAAGLFVEFDESGNPTPPAAEPVVMPIRTKTVEQIVEEAPGPSLAEVQATPKDEQKPIFSADGSVDFAAIYQMASLPAASFGADEVLKILHEFPADLPLESKRATMKVTLGAMTATTGASAETVVADASRKLAALASYSEGFEKQATDFIAKSEAEVARLQSEIERNRANMEGAKAKVEVVKSACLAESDRLDDVLEFFSLDVAPSKYAKP
ncbi:MAG: hypothetical protein JSS66_18370 [Armatimonadetes bacterium]|nr:hypothetical protein [Armatimonadota bacterium]